MSPSSISVMSCLENHRTGENQHWLALSGAFFLLVLSFCPFFRLRLEEDDPRRA